MKKAVLFCTCCGTISATLPPDRLRDALGARLLSAYGKEGPQPACEEFYACSMLCRREESEAALNSVLASGAEAVLAAGCSLSARGFETMKFLGGSTLAEWADIREACAWIHEDAPDGALRKAADILCMGLAALERRAAVAEKPPPCDFPTGEVLVIGGGPAGLACAGALGKMGVRAVLAERRAALGGMLTQLGLLFPRFISGPELAEELIRDVKHIGVQVLPKTTVSGVQPVPGGYRAVLNGKNGEEERRFDAVVLAAGALPVLPRGLYRYGELTGVLSQLELETSLGRVESGQKEALALPRQAVFLQCVAARDENNPYCSAVCCPTSLKNAIRLRSLRPDGSVTVVHRNIATPGKHLEALYRRATASGVLLRSHDPAVTPECLGTERVEGLRFRDALNGEDTVLPADAVVCSTPLKPLPDTLKLAGSLGLRTDGMGFACAREPVQPVSPSGAGIFICGAARWPATVEHCLEQGRAAAAKAAAYMRGIGSCSGDSRCLPVVPQTFWELMPDSACRLPSAEVNGEKCSRCGRCAAVCPYGACFLPEDAGMRVDARKCARCGSCAAVCPTGAASLPGETVAVLRARIKEALSR
ncbi:MAG: 4Fe-4S binding protein [Desulfovibrio sp.]|jgi:heterodisulfide reductase subunit A|nr:4Fe-4S binding protein [Desulfovibrio sp.]